MTDAISDRLSMGLAPGAHGTFGEQNLHLSRADDAKAEAMTRLARAFGTPRGAGGEQR